MVTSIQNSPFFILSTSDPNGQSTASPKGDYSGFVKIEGDDTILIPERIGNKLVFSLSNILYNPLVGCLFMIPNTNETLRLSGRAELIHDADLCNKLESRGKPALLIIRINITEAYFHCAKSILRSELWKPESWPEKINVSFGKQIARNIGKGTDLIEEFDDGVEDSYKTTL